MKQFTVTFRDSSGQPALWVYTTDNEAATREDAAASLRALQHNVEILSITEDDLTPPKKSTAKKED